MKIKLLLLISIFFIPVISIYAQKQAVRIIPAGSYFNSIATDTKDLATAPFKWDQKNWLKAGAITAAGVGLYFADPCIQKFSQRNKTTFTNNSSKNLLEPFGHGYYPAAIVGGFYMYAQIYKNERASHFALTTAKAAIINGAITYAVKHLAHRQRPFQGIEANHTKWDGPLGDFGQTSFISGHTVIAWTFATAISTEYSEYKWVPWLSYSMATLAGLSRIHDNKHWASDVFMGAAFAWFSTKFIFQKNKNTQSVMTKSSPIVTMDYGYTQYGFLLRF
ncbi:MAG: phosphatase PAP2 family protein [Bacteroidales bacterium]|nr:phosphatase PAP2 family protein [Bacteroidales bacterium]